ncbi:Outward-rectifier potassium channel TOK1 [Phlyctema vagabunda]|uniref:Outward-rectifier potassium channel TOK1 n=1 Tax=Phlyctema vagabunda TaxID=108571 RepID=A0ABR4PET9_9HELO
MNDPGLDEPISSDAKDVENQHADGQQKIEDNEQAFLQPSRWWFASTAFPLIAGTFGPMASTFSICALAVKWRVYIPPGGVEEHGEYIQDPKWLVAINAVQLGIALISNLSLLMNMAERARFSIAQPITIVGWYLSSLTLIGLCACAAGPLKLEPSSEYAFTQAFYYALFSAGLYFVVATLMLITAWGAIRGHYDKQFQLTMSQRTLMLQTISYLVYLMIGALIFSHVESWEFLDAVYYANFSLLTIGIGDYSPMTHLGRSLLFPFAIGGIIILGLVVGSIRSLVLERGKEKMGSRMVEKHRRVVLSRMQKKGKGKILEPISDDKVGVTRSSTLGNMTEFERRQQEFELMRQVQDAAARNRRWTSLIISGTTWMFLWLVGAAIFQRCEKGQDWSYFGSLYFAYTSLLTIGYGDFYPQSNSGKPFFVFWSLLAIPSLTILISNMGDTIVKGIRDLTLWVGNITVLPGEQDFKTSLKNSIKKATPNRFFLHKPKKESDPQVQPAQEFSLSSSEQETHLHLLLIREIITVTGHLNSSPPKKYTFDEWARFLYLIGEEEGNAETHRKALKFKGSRRKREEEDEGLGDGPGTGAGQDDDAEGIKKWSWVGNRSPLMGTKDEAEWVLERLTATLEDELRVLHEGDEQQPQPGSSGNASRGSAGTSKRRPSSQSSTPCL